MRSGIFIVLLCSVFCCNSYAQKFYDQVYRPDSVSENSVYESLRVLELFTEGNPDSLFVRLGSDTSVVHPDTLRKYSAWHLKDFNYANTEGKNPRRWTVSPTSFYCRRVYIGDGVQEGDSMMYKGALVVTAEMKRINNEVVITKLRFRITAVTREMDDVLLQKRGKKPANLDRIMKELENNPPSGW